MKRKPDFFHVFIALTFVLTILCLLLYLCSSSRHSVGKPTTVVSVKMENGGDLCVIETIPIWQRLRIYALSFVFGAWVLCRRLLKCLWDSNSLYSLQSRDNPPACLVDTSLGQHKYVKLKVGLKVS